MMTYVIDLYEAILEGRPNGVDRGRACLDRSSY